MSDIDLKRLAVDREYWDEVAPLGATHHWEPSGDWYQDCGDHALAWNFTARGWKAARAPLRITRDEAIPRPTKQEWENGLPPVGTVCEGMVSYGASTKWRKCEILKYRNGQAAVLVDDPGFLAWCEEFRPLKSQHERQREELVDMVCGQGFLSRDGNVSWEIADAILSKYNLEQKP